MKKIVYLFALAVLATSCEDKIDLDLGFAGQKPVIEGRVTTETDSSFVKLSFTAPYNSTQEPPAITNAVVEVSMDNSPAVVFTHVANGVYKPAPGYKGIANHTYKLHVVISGKEYTAESILYPMYQVDTALIQKFEPASGFLDEGYTITYNANYDQPKVRYYWFNYGKNDTLEDFNVFYDNKDVIQNQWLPFELPFFRTQKGDSVMLIFRSVDVYAYNYLVALDLLNSDAPGPFQAPPANPPTNIKGNALGYFYTADIVRRWRIVN